MTTPLFINIAPRLSCPEELRWSITRGGMHANVVTKEELQAVATELGRIAANYLPGQVIEAEIRLPRKP